MRTRHAQNQKGMIVSIGIANIYVLDPGSVSAPTIMAEVAIIASPVDAMLYNTALVLLSCGIPVTILHGCWNCGQHACHTCYADSHIVFPASRQPPWQKTSASSLLCATCSHHTL